jgi:uncharacterized membrane protein YphA (DoxX/SURF4 family)
MKFIVFAIRLLLGTLLLYGGLGAIGRPFDFLASVNAYRMTGPLSGVVVAALLPWLEVVSAICLLSGVLIDGAFFGAILLTASFTVAIGSAWSRGLSISCGCFGGTDDIISAYTFIRAVTLLALAVSGSVLSMRFSKSRPLGTGIVAGAARSLRVKKSTRRFFAVSSEASMGQSISEPAFLAS